MTAKEKAKELYDKMKGFRVKNSHRKKCTLVACAEVYDLELKVGQYLDEMPDKENYYAFWEDVKSEIEKL